MNRSRSEVSEEEILVCAHIVEDIHCGNCHAVFLLLALSQRDCEINAGNIWKYTVGNSPIAFQSQ